MQTHKNWHNWAETLQRYKLGGLASWLLEAGLPLNVLGAQMIYAVQPFVGGKQIELIAHMLENEDELQAFRHFLRNEVNQ
ncbi:MAG TPA: hypothetical protein VLA72_11645 [Anaerolineales bacterium]|jgi:hypothetical protein|nr:hypothetical protein [Anaerolineales bacterium]